MSDFDRNATTLMGAVSQAAKMMHAARSGSLIEFTRVTRVEPVTLVDESIVHIPNITDILQSLNSMFCAYYLQAVSLQVHVGKIDVMKILDSVNPNRDPAQNAGMLIGNALSTESYHFKLPVPGVGIGLEAYGLENEVTDKMKEQWGMSKSPYAGPASAGYARSINEIANLSVGKLLEVQIESDGQTANIPVAVRLIVSEISPEAVVHTLSVGSKDTTVKERYHAWRAGQLSFVRDLILCQDLIDDHRRALMNDKTGIYTQAVQRKNNNTLSALLTGTPSLATASNLAVISDKTAKQLEAVIGGRLSDFRTREKMFKETYMMILAVVEPMYEMIVFYHRSIEQPTTMSFRDVKGASKDNGVDIAKLLQAYHAGANPNL